MTAIPLPLAAAAASVVIKGEPVLVAPAKLPQLLRVIQLLDESDLFGLGYSVFLAASSPAGIDPKVLLTAIAKGGDRFIESFATLLRVERAEMDELDLDDLLLLCTAAIEVNLDFFTQRLMPKLTSLISTISTPPSDDSVKAAEVVESQGSGQSAVTG